MDEIAKFLKNFSCLKHLELRTKCHADLINGHEWKFLAKHLIKLKFLFTIQLHSIEEILDTYRTSFWLEQKRWFVGYHRKYLYTIPCSIRKHVNESFQPPKYRTCLKNAIFCDYVDKLTLEFGLIETCHRFNNITTLEIGCENISVEILSAIVNLHGVKDLVLTSAMNKSKIKYLFHNMPSLQYLSIDTVRKR
jgi:hypothetical protein